MNEAKYSAYINDKLIRFEGVYNRHPDDEIEGTRIISEGSYSFDEIIRKMGMTVSWPGVLYLSDSPKRSWEEFVSHFRLQEAAGGLVKNEKGKYLVIFRRGKWDLPKGKIEYDESPKQAALREVREECGIENLEIVRPISVTFHTYPHNGKQILKKTHWYLMEGNSSDVLKAQSEEDIELVEWMSENKIYQKVFANTYFSIQNLLKGYFSQKSSIETDKT